MIDLFAALAAGVIEFEAPIRLEEEEALCEVETLTNLYTYAQLSTVAETTAARLSLHFVSLHRESAWLPPGSASVRRT